MDKNNGEAYQPEDAATLRRATVAVISRLADTDGSSTADEAAKAVLAVARTGYAREAGRAIDANDLAEAAIARVRAAVR